MRSVIIFLLLLTIGCSKGDFSVHSDKVIDQILSSSDFKPFLHLELPERRPVLLVKNTFIPGNVNASVETRLASVDSLSSEIPYFEIANITKGKNTFKVTFQYLIEGVRGEAVFDNSNYDLIKIEVVEE